MPKKIILSPEIAADFDLLNNTFISKDKEPEVEVGDLMVGGFEPQVKLKRWGNEANFSVRLVDTTPGQADVSADKEKVVWAKGDREARFYAQGWGVDNGAFEFEIVLKQKPPTNQIAFTLQSKELDFFYQTPLTKEEIDGGTERPDNVEGSYAVYHASRGNAHPNQAEADKYRAGKAFHIYRPKLTDALGAEIWADLHIDEQAGTMTITIDQAWLDGAVYPVTVDPNFGYETIGGSNTNEVDDALLGSLFTSPADVATGDSFTFYVDAVTSTVQSKGVLVLHSTLAIVANGVGGAVACSTTAGWRTSTFGTPPNLSASTPYVLMWIHNGAGFGFTCRFFYDAGAADQGHRDLTNSYAAPQNPTGAAHSANKYSIYCTYTAAGIGADEMMAAIGQQTGGGGGSGDIMAHSRKPSEAIAY